MSPLSSWADTREGGRIVFILCKHVCVCVCVPAVCTGMCGTEVSIFFNCFPSDGFEAGSPIEPDCHRIGWEGVNLWSSRLVFCTTGSAAPQVSNPSPSAGGCRGMLRIELRPSWLCGKHLATWAESPACFHSWHQSMRGDTRKKTMIHCANTPPSSSSCCRHLSWPYMVSSWRHQTSGGTRWWECNAAQDSHNQKPFPEHRRDFLQRAVTTSAAIRPLAYFWCYKFIRYHLERN